MQLVVTLILSSELLRYLQAGRNTMLAFVYSEGTSGRC